MARDENGRYRPDADDILGWNRNSAQMENILRIWNDNHTGHWVEPPETASGSLIRDLPQAKPPESTPTPVPQGRYGANVAAKGSELAPKTTEDETNGRTRVKGSKPLERLCECGCGEAATGRSKYVSKVHRDRVAKRNQRNAEGLKAFLEQLKKGGLNKGS